MNLLHVDTFMRVSMRFGLDTPISKLETSIKGDHCKQLPTQKPIATMPRDRSFRFSSEGDTRRKRAEDHIFR